MSRLKKGGAIVAVLVALVGGFEGLRRNAYLDPVGIPTVCYGHTEGVKLGDRYTTEECKALLVKDLEIYAKGIEACVKVTLPDRRYVALVSFAYNVGVKRACTSSVVRLINAGQTRAGCDALLQYTRAMGIRLPGLVKRREKERALCMADL